MNTSSLSGFEQAALNMTYNSTTLLILISAYLFCEIDLKGFSAYGYYAKKLKNIVSPYLVLSIPVLVVTLFFEPYDRGDFLLGIPEQLVTVTDYVVATISYILTGKHLGGFWFIPVICLFFLASPLALQFLRLRVEFKLTIVVISLVISILVFRPTGDVNPIQSFVYLLPLYLMGLTIWKHEEEAAALFAPWILAALFVASFALAWVSARELGTGLNRKDFFEWRGVDYLMLSKVCLSLFLFFGLRRWVKASPPGVRFYADAGLSVYFLHLLFRDLLGRDFARPIIDAVEFVAPNPYATLLVLTVLMIGFCLLVAHLCRKALGRRSRYFIGY